MSDFKPKKRGCEGTHQREKRKTEKEKDEEFVEELAESMPMQEMLGMSQKMDEIQKEVKEIVDKMKLLSEDIKGVVVDETL